MGPASGEWDTTREPTVAVKTLDLELLVEDEHLDRFPLHAIELHGLRRRGRIEDLHELLEVVGLAANRGAVARDPEVDGLLHRHALEELTVRPEPLLPLLRILDFRDD